MAKLTRPKRRRLLLNLYKAYIMQHGTNLKLRQVRFNYWGKSSRSLLGIKLCKMLHSQKTFHPRSLFLLILLSLQNNQKAVHTTV